MVAISGDTLEGVSATTLWTLHNRAKEAKRSDGVIRDALVLIRDCADRFPGGRMMVDSIPPFFSRRTLKGHKLSGRYTAPRMPFGMTPDEGLALAGTVPGVRVARDIPLARYRGIWKVMSSPVLDRGVLRRNRPSITLLEFDR